MDNQIQRKMIVRLDMFGSVVNGFNEGRYLKILYRRKEKLWKRNKKIALAF